jgi:RHS repeat-associated protein
MGGRRSGVAVRRVAAVLAAVAAVVSGPLVTAGPASGAPVSGYAGQIWSPFPLPAWPSVSGAASPAARRAAAFGQPAGVRAVRPERWRPGRVRWPAAGAGTAVLERQRPADGHGRVTGIVSQVAHGWQAAAPDVAVSAAGGQVPAAVTVRVADRRGAAAAGVRGVLLSVARGDGGTGGRVRIRVSYARFAAAYGGAWSSRLRLAVLPGCALSAPRWRQCRRVVPLRSVNNPRTRTLTALVSFPAGTRSADAAAGAGGAGVMTLAAVSGPSGPDGSYTATPLKPTGTWVVQQGSFDYTYPFAVPPALGGAAPPVALGYDSQSVDGETSAANTQAGIIGDGWDYSPGFIERSYQPCQQDSSAAAANAGDQCWAWQNATLSLPGHSGVLVEDSSGTWHSQNDDGTTVQLLQNTTSSGNGLWHGEYWLVTTPDGTKYYFGADHLPGGSGSDPATNSAWGAPVFCPSSGDPCYDSSKGASSQAQMGWRWNLDFVVDPQQNLTVYDYNKETNYYQMGGSSGSGGTLTQYDRGGYPHQISYGWRLPDAIAGAQPDAQVDFGLSERCTAAASTCDANHTAAYWPDVPWDQSCGPIGSCTNSSPTYWTSQMLTSVTTKVLESGSWKTIDSWALSQSFPVAGDSNPVIYLDSITRTGYDGQTGGLSLPSVSFDPPAEIDNRVDGLTPAAPAVYRPRIQAITTEAGAQIQVTYASPACSRAGGTMPSSADKNTMPCFPAWWTPPGDLAPIQDWFTKSLVGQVTESDNPADPVPSPAQVTSYAYLGGAAWHQNMSPAVQSKYRTWDQYRGFGQVKVTTGAAPDPVTETLYTYMQGMDGDANSDGTTKSVTVADPNNDTAVTDSNWLAGQVLETDTYTASGGSVAKRVIGGLQGKWVFDQTADQNQPGTLPDLTARMIDQDTTKTITSLAGGGTGTDTATTYYNGDGQVAAVDHAPQGSAETCTATSYAKPPSGNTMMKAYPDQVTVVTGAYSTTNTACPAAASNNIVSDSRLYYDDKTSTLSSQGTLGSLAYPGGLVTGVQKAVTWPPAGESWQTRSATAYDPYGRVTSVTTPAPAGATGADTTGTVYTPAYTAGQTTELPTTTAVTNPKGWTITTAYDQGREAPVTVTDPNSEVTTETYDQLGRLTSATLPVNQGLTGCPNSTSHCPTYTYAYSIDGTHPPAITTSTLREDKTYSRDVQIFDAMLEPRQEQVTPADNEPGRLISDTFYNSHGWPVKTNTSYYDSSAPPGTALFPTSDGAVPDQARTSYDGMGRVLASQSWSKNALQWQTSNAYPGMNQTDVTPPAGGTATSTFTNVLGQVTASWKYTTAAPDGHPADADVTSYTYTPAGQVASVADNNTNTWTYGYDLLGEKTSFTDPGTTGTSGPNGKAGLTTTTYDSAGDVGTTTDPAGTTLAWTYDILGRKTGEFSGSTTGTKLATWSYDTAKLNSSASTKGQLASSTSYDQSGNAYTQTITGYDTAYQPTGVSETIPASAGSLHGTYTTASTHTSVTGLLSSLAYNGDGGLPPDTVSYTYLTGGLLSNAVGSASNGNYIAQMLYTPLGQPERATFGSFGTQMVRTYYIDPATSRLLQATTSNQTWSGAADVTSYTYNHAGNLTSSSDLQGNSAGTTTGTQTQCYQYNSLGELTTAWTDKGGQTTTTAPSVPGEGGCTNTTPAATTLGGPAQYWETWAYNLLGDRTSQVIHNTAGTTSLDINQTPAYPTAATPAQPDAAASIKTQYGTTGSSDTTTIHYNADGGVTSQTSASTGTSPPPPPPAQSSITYTPQGNTSQVTSGGKTSTYVYDASGNLIMQTSSSGTAVLYLFGGTEQLNLTGGTVTGPAITGGTVTGLRYYPAPDGTAVTRSSAGTNPITYQAADPEHTATQAITPKPGTSPAMTETRRYYDPYGNPAGTPPAWPDNHGYLGKPADPATTLDLLGARQYDPATGRFLSLDPIFQPGNPLAMGGYAYAGNNPATHSDPTGLCQTVCLTDGSTEQKNPNNNSYGNTTGGETNPSTSYSSGTSNTQAPGSGVLPPAVRAAYQHAYLAYAAQSDFKGPALELAALSAFCGGPKEWSNWGCGKALSLKILGDYENLVAPSAMMMQAAEGSYAGSYFDDSAVRVEVNATEDLAQLGCGQSFTRQTRVLLADGKTISISKLRVGEKVLATNTRTGKTSAEIVSAVLVHHDTDRYDLTIKTGHGTAVIHTTSTHLFWDATRHRWVKAATLAHHDDLRGANGVTVTVMGGYVPAHAAGWMWDLTIARDHDFYVVTMAAAILVHNNNCDTPQEGDQGYQSRGSTGRTTSGGANEARAMDYAKQYPQYGDVLPVNMSDPRWQAEDGWVKMSQTIDGVEIHYAYNLATAVADDFKFKDWAG